MKNIVICCDGTANQFSVDRTNVLKLCYTLVQGPGQVTFYHPGVGTMPAIGALTFIAKQVTKVLGLAFGYGLESDIRDAYVFLMNCYEEGDKVFLFGFSRGAYTVRALAAFIHLYGLIGAGNEPLVPYALRMLVALQKSKPKEFFALAREFSDTFSPRRCPIHFVGVWDTVSSVGWVGNPLRLAYTANNPSIAIGRHAVSIDERRAFFRSNLWLPKPDGGPVDCKQVWFIGTHCDVGGGHPEKESGLSKIALKWMIAEAAAHGLKVRKDRVDYVLGDGPGMVPPNIDAKLHNSYLGWLLPLWVIAEYVPKKHYDAATGRYSWRMNLFRRRQIPDDAIIHESVRERPGYSPRLPPAATFETTRDLQFPMVE